MTREYGYKDFDATPVRSSKGPPNQSLGPVTSNSINRGLAAMPAQERSIAIEERALGADQPQRPYREAMARNTSPKGSKPRADGRSGCSPAPVPAFTVWATSLKRCRFG